MSRSRDPRNVVQPWREARGEHFLCLFDLVSHCSTASRYQINYSTRGGTLSRSESSSPQTNCFKSDLEFTFLTFGGS